MVLPIFKDDNQNLMLMQNNWVAQLNPLLASPISKGLLLNNIALSSGANVINHKLSRNMQGWFITDIDNAASIYRSAPFNNSTLTLTSNVTCNVALWVF